MTTSYTLTDSEQKRRMRMASHNLNLLYEHLEPYIKGGFENKSERYSDYDMFMKVNLRNRDSHCYLTKEYFDNEICIFNMLQITLGSLTGIECTYTEEQLYSNIQLGNLEIDSNTTVGLFAQAVVENNEGFEYDDQITFISGDMTSTTDNHGNYIYNTHFSAAKVILEQNSNELLSSLDVLDNIPYIKGFQSYDGKLALNVLLDELSIYTLNHIYIQLVCYAWIHSRKEDGKLLVSTQHLNCPSDVQTCNSDYFYYYALLTFGYNVYYNSENRMFKDVEPYLEPAQRPNPPVIVFEPTGYNEYEVLMTITADNGCDIYVTYTLDYSGESIGRVPDLDDVSDDAYNQTMLYDAYLGSTYIQAANDFDDWGGQTFTVMAVAVSRRTGRKSEVSSASLTWELNS